MIANTTYPNAEIIIADNASTDDSVAFLKTNFPSIKIVTNDKNTGYAGGYNDALRKIESDYYVLLNSDVEVTPNWIENIMDFMLKDKLMVACQPKILNMVILFVAAEFLTLAKQTKINTTKVVKYFGQAVLVCL